MPTRRELAEQFVPHSPFAQRLGLIIERLDSDGAELRMPFDPQLVTIVAALVVDGVAVAALVGRYWPGRVHTGSAAAHGATIVRYRIRSRFVHETLPQTAATPPGGGSGRPLLVFLHGRGRDGNESNSNGAFYSALRALGSRAPDVVFPNGGDHSYWHRRASGDWTRYVLDEVIPTA